MALPGEQHEKLSEALQDAFRDEDRFEQFVRYRFDKNLYKIVIANNLEQLAFKLIDRADAEGWVRNLILGARQSNPGNQQLIEFCREFFTDTSFLNIYLPLELSERGSRERIIRATNPFLDPIIWLVKLSEILPQVCHIEYIAELPEGRRKITGTGFLIAPNVVITNFHVMEYVIKEKAAYSDVILRFDYNKLSYGKFDRTGTEYRLKEDWLIDQSPYLPDNENRLPTLDELDYALLRVKNEPGNRSVGEEGSPARGWIKLPTESDNFSPNTPLFILQHPNDQPLKLVLDTDGIIDVNENGTMVRYKTNTELGSSGSPCFNINWELVALHHMGIENQYNGGTPFSTICSRLERQNLLAALRSGQAI
jgi:V8-like Glu-specific endopeptidase